MPLDAAGVPNGIERVAGRGHGGFSNEQNGHSKLLCLEFLHAQGIISTQNRTTRG